MISEKVNIADIERHVNNYFNPENNPAGKRKRPPEFLALAKRILDYRNTEDNVKGIATFKQGQRSVTFAQADGVTSDWTHQFKNELAPYRRAKFI